MSPRSSGRRTCRLIPVIAGSAATTQSRSGEREIGTQLSPEGAVAAVAQRSRSTVAASTDGRFLVSCMALGYVGNGAWAATPNTRRRVRNGTVSRPPRNIPWRRPSADTCRSRKHGEITAVYLELSFLTVPPSEQLHRNTDD